MPATKTAKPKTTTAAPAARAAKTPPTPPVNVGLLDQARAEATRKLVGGGSGTGKAKKGPKDPAPPASAAPEPATTAPVAAITEPAPEPAAAAPVPPAGTTANGAGPVAVAAGKKPRTPKPVPAAKKDKPLGGLAAAAKVLAEAGVSMKCTDLVDRVISSGLWASKGETPAATIYAAIIREIAAKGAESRFVKTGKGQFAARTG
jgi:hypothetical protein